MLSCPGTRYWESLHTLRTKCFPRSVICVVIVMCIPKYCLYLPTLTTSLYRRFVIVLIWPLTFWLFLTKILGFCSELQYKWSEHAAVGSWALQKPGLQLKLPFPWWHWAVFLSCRPTVMCRRNRGNKERGEFAIFVNSRWCDPGHITVKDQGCEGNIKVWAIILPVMGCLTSLQN